MIAARRPSPLALAALISLLPAAGQPASPPELDVLAEKAGPLGLYRFGSYDSQKGLRNLATTLLTQDPQGYLWVTSEDGLYRYNGYRFRRYDRSHGLPLSNITAILVSGTGDLWVGTMGGLARKEGEGFAVPPGPGEARINALANGPDGAVLAAASTGLFATADGRSFQMLPGWPGGPAHALWADDSEVVAAQGGRILTLARGVVTETTEIPGWREPITSLARDGAGTLWALSGRRVWLRAPGPGAFVPWKAELPPIIERARLSLDRKGRLWVPTTRGFLVALGAGTAPGSDRWLHVGPKQGFPDTPAAGLYEDREGTLWIAGMGVHRLLGRGQWRSHNARSGFSDASVRAIHRDQAGTLWVGTDAGLWRALADRWQLVPPTSGRPVRAIVEADDGTLLIGGSPVELGVLDPDRLAVRWLGREANLSPDYEKILALARTGDGSLWIATGTGLLRAKARPPFAAEPVALPGAKGGGERISDLVVDAAGRLWAAGERGLLVLDGERWRRFTTADGLRHDYVVYLGARRTGEVCAAYREPLGVVCLRLDRASSLRHLDSTTGLGQGRIYALAEDQEGQLWLGAGMGVDVVGEGGVRHFGLADGLPGEDTSSRGLTVDVDGSIWLGTSTGLGHFSGPVFGDTAAPPTLLEAVRFSGRSVPLDRAATVRWTENTMEAEFAGLSFAGEASLQHEVRLVGIESWHAVDGRSVRYPALPPGSYRFEARARHPGGEWGRVAAFDFVIEAAWWQTAWARVLGALGLLSLGALGVVWRARALNRRNRRLARRNKAQARTLAALRQARQRIGAVAAELRGEAQQLAATAAQQIAAVSQQKDALREVGESVHVVTETSRAAAQRAQSVVAEAEQSEQLSAAGRADVTGTIESLAQSEEQIDLTARRIGALDERGEHIGSIIDSVSELAETTSMLALNAALEAARASEKGQGFLVIAQEMQRLADQSKAAAGKVRGILEEIAKEMRAALTETEAGRHQTRQAREHAARAGETIARLSALIGEFAHAARQIAGDAQHQKQGIERVLEAIDALQSGMADAALAVEGMERASGSLARQSQHLTEELQAHGDEPEAD